MAPSKRLPCSETWMILRPIRHLSKPETFFRITNLSHMEQEKSCIRDMSLQYPQVSY